MNSNNLIDMSLDDIIKLNRLNKKRQNRPIVQNKSSKPKGKLSTKFRHFSSPMNRSNLITVKDQENKRKKHFQRNNNVFLQAKRVQFRQQQLQRQRQNTKAFPQNRRQNFNKIILAKKNRNNNQFLDSHIPIRISSSLPTRKYFRRKPSISQVIGNANEDILTISINNNLSKRPQFQRENLSRPRLLCNLPIMTTTQISPIMPSQFSRPKGVKGLRPPINHTTKTLNDRFSNNNPGIRVVFS